MIDAKTRDTQETRDTQVTNIANAFGVPRRLLVPPGQFELHETQRQEFVKRVPDSGNPFARHGKPPPKPGA